LTFNSISILVKRAGIGTCDHSFSSSIAGKIFAENSSLLPEFFHVPGLLTSTVINIFTPTKKNIFGVFEKNTRNSFSFEDHQHQSVGGTIAVESCVILFRDKDLFQLYKHFQFTLTISTSLTTSIVPSFISSELASFEEL
jgi:hypothetical protein